MKHAVQVTITGDGCYAVTQLIKQPGDREYTNTGNSLLVDKDEPTTDNYLLGAIQVGLRGGITQTKYYKP